MAEIVNLHTYRTNALEQKAFGPWQQRFGERYNQQSRLADLSNRTLYALARPGEENAVAFYELIMGILELGSAVKFYYLENKEQMMVMDIHLFLADQVRFEMLQRLNWLTGYPCAKYSLFEMVRDFDKVKIASMEKSPQLAESHADFAAYAQLSAGDKEVFIRRMLPQALKIYKEKLQL